MTTRHDKFVEILENYPSLRHYWTGEGRDMECHLNADNFPGALSSGETLVLQILVSIFRGNGEPEHLKIDITDLATLDSQHRRPIIEWLIDPFWP